MPRVIWARFSKFTRQSLKLSVSPNQCDLCMSMHAQRGNLDGLVMIGIPGTNGCISHISTIHAIDAGFESADR
jgi:hypothetical protein